MAEIHVLTELRCRKKKLVGQKSPPAVKHASAFTYADRRIFPNVNSVVFISPFLRTKEFSSLS